MKLTLAKKLGIGLAAICLLGMVSIVALYHFRKLSLSEILSPDYWLRQAKGTGNYDPDQAILFRGNPNLKEIALTIDDGPHELYGPEVLDVLRQYQVPATFFVVGVRVKACPDLIRRMVLEGHEVGNHTYDHQRLNKLKPHAIANELRDDAVNIFQSAGVHTTIMRPPGVRYDNQVLHVSKSLGYVTVSWTTAAKDYLNQSPDYIVRSVVDRTENGSIILLHQDNPYTAEALPRIIIALKAKGYKFVTISTMLAHLKVEPYASEQKEAEASANGQPFVLANGRTVLTGEPIGGPEVSRYVPPIFAASRQSRIAVVPKTSSPLSGVASNRSISTPGLTHTTGSESKAELGAPGGPVSPPAVSPTTGASSLSPTMPTTAPVKTPLTVTVPRQAPTSTITEPRASQRPS